ncbi:MAG TPA: hypothetical protein VGG64_14430 [Pirellulales bacterium]|jgi:uncharacterized membrane protein
MLEMLTSPTGAVVIGVAAVAILVVTGIYVVGRVKSSFREDGPKTNELLTNFRELHSRGELTDVEYRTIKAMLSARLQDELRDSGKEA